MRTVCQTWALLWTHLRARYGSMMWVWGLLLILTPVTEGISVFLVLPLFQSLGLQTANGQAPQPTIAESVGMDGGLHRVLLILLVAIVLHEIIKCIQAKANIRLHARFVADLRERLFRAVARTRWAALARLKLATLHKTITEDVERSFGVLKATEDAWLSIATLVAYVFMAAWVSPLFTALVLFAGTAYLLVVRRPLKHMERLGKEVSQTYGNLYMTIADYLTFIKTFKSYEKVNDAIKRFEESSELIAEVQVKEVDTAANLEAGYKIAGAFGLCMFVYVALEVMRIPVASLLFLVLVLSRVALRIPGIVRACLTVASHGPSLRTVFSRIEECEAETEAERNLSQALGQDTSPIEIEFEDVCFAYECGKPVLQDFSISIPARKTIAVMGHSGSGKSTFMDILVGLLEPDSGHIRVNGEIADAHRLVSLRGATAYVGQEMFLFHGTVRENLLWGAEGSTPAEIDAALDAAQAADYVAALSKGLETVVGDRGATLSAGQRQRLALARALLRKPRLLILDEPTSALDLDSENQIVRTLDRLKGSTTIIIASHRMNAIRCADQVYAIEQGFPRMIGSGIDVFDRSPELVAVQTK